MENTVIFHHYETSEKTFLVVGTRSPSLHRRNSVAEQPFSVVVKQLLLLPHSLFPCVHGMLRSRSRRTERMNVLVLRKGTGAVALGGAVERAQLCCQK